MAENQNSAPNAGYTEAPLQVSNFVDPTISPVPRVPLNLYSLFGTTREGAKAANRAPENLNVYEKLMRGEDIYAGGFPNIEAPKINQLGLEPLQHSGGFEKYGYSSLMHGGDNEDRYAQNFRRENPALFMDQPGWHPLNGIYRAGYWGGAFIEKTAESAVVKAGQGLAFLYGATLGNVGKFATGESYEGFGDWMAKAGDNILSNTINGWDNWLKERYHYFQEKEDRGRQGFMQSLGDGDFWMNDISDGLGFMLSAMLEVGLVSRVGLGVKTATRISNKIAKVSTEALSAAEDMGGAGKAFGKVGKLFGKPSPMIVKNAVDYTTQTLATTAIESMVEADQTKQDVYNSYEGKINPETAQFYSDDERKRLAAGAAAEVFKQNMLILIGPKFLETYVFNKVGKHLFGKVAPGEGTASDNVKVGKIGEISRAKLRTRMFKNSLKFGKYAGIGFVSEGLWEENIQQAIQTTATNAFGAGKYNRPSGREDEVDRYGREDELDINPWEGAKQFFSALSPAGDTKFVDALGGFFGGSVGETFGKQTTQFRKGISDSRYVDDQLSKSIGIGALMGIGGGTIAANSSRIQQNKVDHYWIKRLKESSANFLDPKTYYKYAEPVEGKDPTVLLGKDNMPVIDVPKLQKDLAQGSETRNLLEIIQQTDDSEDSTDPGGKDLNKLARRMLFAKMAMDYVRAGKKDALMENLKNIQEFSDIDIQALGYAPGLMTAGKKAAITKETSKMISILDRAHTWVNENVLDNVSEKRDGLYGLRYTKAQRQKRAEFFAAKKEYLLSLAMQKAINDSYDDEVDKKLGEAGEVSEEISQSPEDFLSSVVTPSGESIRDTSISLNSVLRDYNEKLPAINNHIESLRNEFMSHFNKMMAINDRGSSNKTRQYHWSKAQDALTRLAELERQAKEIADFSSKFMGEDKAFTLEAVDGEHYIVPTKKDKNVEPDSIEKIQADKKRRLLGVRKQEIKIQNDWIAEEWKRTAALKEPKTEQGREDKRMSRRMTGSKNAYNEYYQREVASRQFEDDTKRPKLWHADEAMKTDARKYKNYEERVLRKTRIKSQVYSIFAQANGERLLELIKQLLERDDLSSEEFGVELKSITDQFSGKPIYIEESIKDGIIDNQVQELEDEKKFLSSMSGQMQLPNDERFNSKYYDRDSEGNFVPKSEFKDIHSQAPERLKIQSRIDVLVKAQDFLDNTDFTIINSWDDVNKVRREIADEYTQLTDEFIDTFNRISDNGQSEVAGDSLSSQQELDAIDGEINELGQLKVIFQDRDKKDGILSTPPFKDFISDSVNPTVEEEDKEETSPVAAKVETTETAPPEATDAAAEEATVGTSVETAPETVVTPEATTEAKTEVITTLPDSSIGLDNKIKYLKYIRNLVKERLGSRLRENREFLTDTVNNSVNQFGLEHTGEIMNQGIYDVLSKNIPAETLSILNQSLNNLKTLLESIGEKQTKENSVQLEDAYWKLNGEIAAIQEVIKASPGAVNAFAAEIQKQKNDLITKIRNTFIGKQDQNDEIVDNIGDSVLGTLQVLFHQVPLFTRIGQKENLSRDEDYDDSPSSPIFKFKEDYNLRKLVRRVNEDDSRTPDNSRVQKGDLQEFLDLAKKMQDLLDLGAALDTKLNMVAEVALEKAIIEKKIAAAKEDGGDTTFRDTIISSTQQIFFMRTVANFMKRATIKDPEKVGFRNWSFIQAPGGAGKTTSIGTWFSLVTGVPKSDIIVSAFTAEAANSLKDIMKMDDSEPSDIDGVMTYIEGLISSEDYSKSVLIVDEYPAMNVFTQKKLFDLVSTYTKNKMKAGEGEFKVVTMGDTNQLTFSTDGALEGASSSLINPNFFNVKGNTIRGNDNHLSKISVIPSLTVNFRTNLFAITSFLDNFKGSSKDNINENIKASSTDPSLSEKDVKGVVAVSKSEFMDKITNYLKINKDSPKTKAVIVNEHNLEKYKKHLTDNGIEIKTDPNDELSKGVYVTTVINAQGFSFDEVFVDIDSKDKKLFSKTVSKNLVYNKAMYVAASRARSLIVFTNFPSAENISDENIAGLESKAIEELFTKDTKFTSDRAQELNGMKNILGEEKFNELSKDIPIITKEPADSDPEASTLEETEEEPEVEEDLLDGETTEIITGEPVGTNADVDDDKDGEKEESEEEGILDDGSEEEGVSTDGIENDDESSENEDTTGSKEDNAAKKLKDSVAEKIRDKTLSAFNVLKKGVVNLVYNTAQTIRYKIEKNKFRTNVPPEGEYENRDLRAGDKVLLVPFIRNTEDESGRNYGYAVVTPALDPSGNEIPGQFRTVSVLSDKEIKKLDSDKATKHIGDAIAERDKKGKLSIFLKHSIHISNPNGFNIGSDVMVPILEGKIEQANSIKYFFKKKFATVTGNQFRATWIEEPGLKTSLVEEFVNNFYGNRMDLSPEEKRKIREFYMNEGNVRIFIPTLKDARGENTALKLPQDYSIKAGRPYMVFFPFDRNSSVQFLPLSRKFLNSGISEHQEILLPIKNFINLGRDVKKMFKDRKIEERLGYEDELKGLIYKVFEAYNNNSDSEKREITVEANLRNDGKLEKTKVSFSFAEARKISDFYKLYKSPVASSRGDELKTVKDIKAVMKVNNKGVTGMRDRNLTVKGVTYFGKIDSLDEINKTFVIRTQDGKLTEPLSGTITVNPQFEKGPAQKALDQVMNANGHLASIFRSGKTSSGFATNQERDFSHKKRGASETAPGYTFMDLLGNKEWDVPSAFNEEGKETEHFEDVIDILETLFNFTKKGELPASELEYYDREEKKVKKTKVQFRVPVPMSKRLGDGSTLFNYSFDRATNTSRSNPEFNESYFETNFETVVPSHVHASFENVERKIPTVKPAVVSSEQPTKQEQTVSNSEKNTSSEGVNPNGSAYKSETKNKKGLTVTTYNSFKKDGRQVSLGGRDMSVEDFTKEYGVTDASDLDVLNGATNVRVREVRESDGKLGISAMVRFGEGNIQVELKGKSKEQAVSTTKTRIEIGAPVRTKEAFLETPLADIFNMLTDKEKAKLLSYAKEREKNDEMTIEDLFLDTDDEVSDMAIKKLIIECLI